MALKHLQKNLNKRYAPLFIVVSLLVLYWVSIPRSVMLEDDGLFILSSYFWGTAHPPGYPLYTFISHWFSIIDIGTLVFRMHFFSSILAILTCIVTYHIMLYKTKSCLVAIGTSLIYGVSEHFWSQAIIAEVYTLHTLLILLAYYFCIKLNEHFEVKYLYYLSLFLGLNITNHWPLFIFILPLFLFTLWSYRQQITLIRLLKMISIFLTVLIVPYLIMVIRSWSDPLITFVGPIDTWTEFFVTFFRQGYIVNKDSTFLGWLVKGKFFLFFIYETIKQYAFLPTIFVAFGIFYTIKNRRKEAYSELIAFCTGSFILLFLLDFHYDFLGKALVRPYLLIPFALFAIWIGVGVHYSARLLFQKTKLVSIFVSLVFLIIVSWGVFYNGRNNYKANDSFAEDQARLVLNELEQNAILFLDSDLDLPIIAYLHYIEGVRKDITLYNTKALLFKNRIVHPYVPPNIREEYIKNLTYSTPHPVYSIINRFVQYNEHHYGFFRKVNKQVRKPGVTNISIIPEFLEYYIRLVQQEPPRDNWHFNLYQFLLFNYGELLGLYKTGLYKFDNTALLDRALSLAETNLYSLHAIIEVLMYHKQVDINTLFSLVNKAEKMVSNARISTERLARIYFLKGSLYYRQGSIYRAIEYYKRSQEIYNKNSNMAKHVLNKL